MIWRRHDQDRAQCRSAVRYRLRADRGGACRIPARPAVSSRRRTDRRQRRSHPRARAGADRDERWRKAERLGGAAGAGQGGARLLSRQCGQSRARLPCQPLQAAGRGRYRPRCCQLQGLWRIDRQPERGGPAPRWRSGLCLCRPSIWHRAALRLWRIARHGRCRTPCGRAAAGWRHPRGALPVDGQGGRRHLSLRAGVAAHERPVPQRGNRGPYRRADARPARHARRRHPLRPWRSAIRPCHNGTPFRALRGRRPRRSLRPWRGTRTSGALSPMPSQGGLSARMF
ncbi:hypothetical protein Ga0061061_101496 [Chelatococcus sambhunathii]|uniref:Uncharacterized protein n=1 Tax=Chelatococcus sambhunathii TaxID=363953 RepID=A0ABM9U2D1_9HYPH|nr:hypothetical protein Ga0061061_101496 [Chelatococcus sambhunathii]